jgi:hypothetical protein
MEKNNMSDLQVLRSIVQAQQEQINALLAAMSSTVTDNDTTIDTPDFTSEVNKLRDAGTSIFDDAIDSIAPPDFTGNASDSGSIDLSRENRTRFSNAELLLAVGNGGLTVRDRDLTLEQQCPTGDNWQKTTLYGICYALRNSLPENVNEPKSVKVAMRNVTRPSLITAINDLYAMLDLTGKSKATVKPPQRKTTAANRGWNPEIAHNQAVKLAELYNVSDAYLKLAQATKGQRRDSQIVKDNRAKYEAYLEKCADHFLANHNPVTMVVQGKERPMLSMVILRGFGIDGHMAATKAGRRRLATAIKAGKALHPVFGDYATYWG